jgi:Golgi phosphoprotein 3 (GPP34)
VAVLIEGASDPGGAWLESGPVLIAEDVLLLLTDDTSGRLSTARSGDAAVEVEILLTGANLVELALMRRVDISREVKPIRILGIWWDDRRVDGPIVCDPSPTGDAVLDTALGIVRRKRQDIFATWARPSARDLPVGPDPRGATGRGLQMKLYGRLASRGMVRYEPSIWALGNADRWPAQDDRHKVEVRRWMIQALVEQTTPDTLTAALIALLHTIKLEPQTVDHRRYGVSKRQLVERAEQIANSQLGARGCS